jgi:hypothetical protein
MKVEITLNRIKVTKNIPLSWKEVTFEQFIKLAEARQDFAAILSVFTDIDPETLRKAQITNLPLIMDALSFIDKQPLDTTIPDSILGYKLPKNLEAETIAQFEDLKLEAMEVKDKGLSKYTVITAIYLVNPYDYNQAVELSSQLLKAPCEEVVAIGNFTLTRLIDWKSYGLKNILKPPSLMKKLKLAMTAYLARLAFTVRYYLWKNRLRSIARSY